MSQKSAHFLFSLFILFISNCLDCNSMDLFLNDDSNINSSNRRAEFYLTLTEEDEEPTVNYENISTKIPLNTLIQDTLESNKENVAKKFGYADLNIPPRETAFFTYSSSDSKAIFFDNLDEKFINYVPRNMRRTQWWLHKILQGAFAVPSSAAGFGAVPAIMVGAGPFLDFLPENSSAGEAFGYTLAASFIPSGLVYGCELAEDIKKFTYPTGLELNIGDDRKPQIFSIDWKTRLYHRLIAGTTFIIEAVPLVLFFWNLEGIVAQHNHSQDGLYWAAGFTIPYALYLGKIYKFSMKSQEKNEIQHKNEESKIEGIKKLLKHQLNTLRVLVNGEDSDALAIMLDKEFRRIMRGKSLCLELNDILRNEKNNECISEILFEYAAFEIKEKKISTDLIKKMKDHISQHIPDLLLETQDPHEIYSYIQRIIKDTIFENDLTSSILINDQQHISKLMYKYITGRDLREDETLAKEKEDNDFREEITNLIREINNSISSLFERYDNEREHHLWEATEKIRKKFGYLFNKNNEMSESAISLLFTKYINLINYNKQLGELTKKAREVAFKQQDETSELIQVTKDLKTHKVEGMYIRRFDEEKLPPEPSSWQWLAHRVQGAAMWGRVQETLYPFNILLDLRSWLGFGLGWSAAVLDTFLRPIAERDALEEFYTKRPYFEKSTDYSWLRGAGNILGIVPSTASCLAKIGLIFTMGAELPSYINVMLAAGVVCTEFPLDFMFHIPKLQKITTFLVSGEPDCVEDTRPERARSRLNQLFKEVEDDIFKFNAPTAMIFYERMSGIDTK